VVPAGDGPETSPSLKIGTELGLAGVEIIARIERRRAWTAEENTMMFADVAAAGGKVSVLPAVAGLPSACSIGGAWPRLSCNVRRRRPPCERSPAAVFIDPCLSCMTTVPFSRTEA
jgi:hypothetical protein